MCKLRLNRSYTIYTIILGLFGFQLFNNDHKCKLLLLANVRKPELGNVCLKSMAFTLSLVEEKSSAACIHIVDKKLSAFAPGHTEIN